VGGRQFKVCLVGNGYVGKTSIREKYLGGGFKASYIPTLGVDFAQKKIEYEGIPTNLIIWDIAGQPLFQKLRRRYYDGSSGIILAYSVVDRQTFDDASKWLVEAHGYMDNLPPIIIAGNKIDLRPKHPEDRTVSTEEGREFTERISKKLDIEAMFIESSALTGENIDEMFEELTRMMLEKVEPGLGAPKEEEAVSEGEASEEVAASDTASIPTSTPEIPSAEQTASRGTSSTSEVDPFTSMAEDSPYLKEDRISEQMSELMTLREELLSKQEELAHATSDIESDLLKWKNTVHVKKIMYNHLREQLKETRDEWAEAYERYKAVEKRKETEIARKRREIDEIKVRIDRVGNAIRRRVSELDLKELTG
jgi:small GTP-binding protein